MYKLVKPVLFTLAFPLLYSAIQFWFNSGLTALGGIAYCLFGLFLWRVFLGGLLPPEEGPALLACACALTAACLIGWFLPAGPLSPWFLSFAQPVLLLIPFDRLPGWMAGAAAFLAGLLVLQLPNITLYLRRFTKEKDKIRPIR